MGKKTSSQTQTQQQQIPAWIESFGRDTLGQADVLSGMGRSYIPEFSTDTQAYFDAARNYGGTPSVNVGQVSSSPVTASTIGGAPQIGAAQIAPVMNISADRFAQYIPEFMNPYTQSVVDTSLADFDVGTDRTLNALQASRDAGSAFGSRAVLDDNGFLGEANRGRGALSANIRSQGFNTALGAAQAQGGQNLSAYQSNQSANLQRSIAQAQLEQDAAARNAGMTLDTSRFNAGQTQNAALANSDQAFRAGIFNTDTAARLGMYNADNARNDNLTRIGLLGDVGSQIDARNLQVANEPWDILQRRAALLGMTPYPTSTTTTGSTQDSKLRAWGAFMPNIGINVPIGGGS